MKYLWLFTFMAMMLGCNEVVPGTCYPNPAGGAGGAGSMPIGAGVGATTSGDFETDLPKEPLGTGNGNGDTYSYCVEDNPCVSRCSKVGMGTFSPSIFKFVTTVADNGKGKAGGWQSGLQLRHIGGKKSVHPER